MKKTKIKSKNVPEFTPPNPKFIERVHQKNDSISEDDLKLVEQLTPNYFFKTYEDYIYEINFPKDSKLRELHSYSLCAPILRINEYHNTSKIEISQQYSHIYSITFPPSLKHMDTNCLGRCNYLYQILFLKDDNGNNFLSNICNNAMTDTKIESITIPPNIKNIGSQCFPKTLKTIEFEQGCPKLKTIGKLAFSNTQIEKFSVPLNVDPFYKSKNFFLNCKNLKTVIFDQFVNKEKDDKNYEEDEEDDDDNIKNNLLSQTKIENLEIFSTNIKKFSFFNTENLVSITIPKGKGCRYVKQKGLLYTKDKKKLIVGERNIKNAKINSNCVSIENFAFNIKSLEKVSFENNSELNRISSFAFSGSKIRKINIPDSVEIIGQGCFFNCKKLESINLSKSLRLFDNSTFSYTKLAEVKIPKSVRCIQSACFYKCNNLISVLFNDDSELTEIHDLAFAETNIVSISIPKSVRLIGDYCFINCHKLKTIDFEENSSISYLGIDCFLGTKIEEIQLPSTVNECHFSNTNIKNISIEVPGSMNFVSDLSSLLITEFSIPSTVEFISSFAFLDCMNLSIVKMIDITNSKLKEIRKGAFLNCKSLKEFQIPKSVRFIGVDAFKNCRHFKAQISLYSKSEKIVISNSAFFNTRITSFYSKSREIIIDDFAFQNCKHLKKFAAKASENSYFGCSSFLNCTSLSIVKIYQETKEITIERECFSNTSIKEFKCPNSLLNIPDFCFKCCSKLTDVIINEDSKINKFGKESFYETKIKSIFIPKDTIEIGQKCFTNCKDLKEITFSEKLNSKNHFYLYERAFESSSVEKVHFPKCYWSILYACFRNCNNLKTVTFSEDSHICDLGESSFESTCIESIKMPKFNITSRDYDDHFNDMLFRNILKKARIEKNTFKNCKQLKKVTFINKEVYVKNFAFYNCESLQEIKFPYLLIDELSQNKNLMNNYPRYIVFTSDEQIKDKSIIKSFFVNKDPPFSYHHSFDMRNSMLLNDDNLHLNLSFETFDGNDLYSSTKISPTTNKDKIKFRTIEHKEGGYFLDCRKKLFSCDFSTIELNVPKETEIIKSNAFKFTNLKKIDFESGSNLKKIKNFVFEGLQIEEITIPDSVTHIGNSAFRDCRKLSKVNINETSQLTNIGKSAFEKTSIEFICFPTKLKTIDDMAFYECINLRQIDNNSKKIEFHYKSFYRSSIETINFPSKCSFLNSSFKECLKLKHLTFLDKPQNLLFGEESFAFSGLEELKIECDNIDIYENSFIYCSSMKQVSLKGKSIKCSRNSFVNTKLDSCILISKVSNTNDVIEDVFNSMIDKISLALKIQKEKNKITQKHFMNHKCYVIDNVLYYANLIDNLSLFEKNPPGKKIQMKKNEILRVPSNVKKLAFPLMSHIQKIQWAPNCNVEDLGPDRFFSYYNLTEITIPKLVKKLSPHLFENCHFLKVVEFEPESKLEEIGEFAFANTRIEKINLPETVHIIGDSTFFNDFKLKEVFFNGRVIGKDAFSRTGILEFSLSNNTELIKDGAFQYCHSLTKFNIDIENSKLSEIGSFSFAETSITEINFPESLRIIGDFAFDGCQFIKEIIFSKNSKLEIVGKNPFYGNLSLKLISIPSTIGDLIDKSKLKPVCFPYFAKEGEINKEEIDETFIDNYCFISTNDEKRNPKCFEENGYYIVDQELKYINLFNNSLLYDKNQTSNKENEILHIPKEVKKLNFNYLSHIQEIQWDQNCIVEDLGPEGFFSFYSLTEITIPKHVKKLSPHLFEHCHFLSKVSFDEESEITEIGDFSFSNTGIESIHLPKSVLYIGKCAFFNDYKLKEVSFEGEIIGEKAFANSGIISFTLSNKTKYIGQSAFQFCHSLKKIKLDCENSNLREIGSFAFSDTSIVDFTFPSKVKTIKTSTFEGCQFLKHVIFSATSKLTKIEDYCFSNNISLETINLPKTTKIISFTSFINTPSLKYIMNKPSQYFRVMSNFTVYGKDRSLIFVPRNLTKFKVSKNCIIIHSGSFCGPAIEKVVFSDKTLICIEKCAFAHSTSLKKIQLPNSLRFIGEEAFINCQSLENIEFEPITKLREIPNFCFAFSGLKTVKFPVSLEVIKNSAFYFSQNLKSVNLYNTNVKFIGDFAFCENNLDEIMLPPSVRFIGSHAFGNNKTIKLVDFTKLPQIKDTNQLPIISFSRRIMVSNRKLKKSIQQFVKKEKQANSKEIENPEENEQQLSDIPQISANIISKKKPSIVRPNVTSPRVSSQSKIRNNDSILPVLPPPPPEYDQQTKSPRKLKESNEYELNHNKFTFTEKYEKDEDFSKKNSPCFIHELAFSKSSVKMFSFDLHEYKWFSFFDFCDDIEKFTLNEYMTIYLHKTNDDYIKSDNLTGSFYRVKNIESEEDYSIPMSKYPFKIRRILNPFNFCDFSKLTKITICDDIDIDEIPRFCFSYSALEEITIPSSLSSIGSYAFSWCNELNKVEFSKKSELNEILEGAFIGCKKLISINLPNEIKIIPKRCFSSSGLLSIKLPKSTKLVDSNAFYDCSKLSTITFNKNIQEIGEFSFANNHSLESIELPDSLRIINSYSFSNCSNLKEVLTTENTNLVEIHQGSFENTQIEQISINRKANILFEPICVPKLNKITFYQGPPEFFIQSDDGSIYEKIENDKKEEQEQEKIIREIIDKSYNNFSLSKLSSLSKEIKRMIIPNFSLKLLFAPKNLDKLKIEKDCFSMSKAIINDMYNLEKIEYSECGTNYVMNFPYFNHLSTEKIKEIKILGNFSFFDENVFSNFKSLEIVEFGEKTNLSHIPKFSFFNCSNLQQIKIPSSCYSIDECAFKNCYKLEIVEFCQLHKENHLNYIGKEAFLNCSSLVSIILPPSLQMICECSFMNCVTLEKVIFENISESKLSTIKKNAFKNCKSLKSFILPKNCNTVGTACFMNCTSLKTFEYEGINYSNIQSRTFKNCDSLIKFEIKNQMKPDQQINIPLINIMSESFMNCKSLKEISIEDGSQTFNTIEKEEEKYTICKYSPPRDIKYQAIHKKAFSNCNSLEKARFFIRNLMCFDDMSFENCTSLKKIEINTTYFSLLMKSNKRSNSFVGTNSELSIDVFNNNKFIGITFKVDNKPSQLKEKRHFKNHLSSLSSSLFKEDENEFEQKIIKERKINRFCILFRSADKRNEDEDEYHQTEKDRQLKWNEYLQKFKKQQNEKMHIEKVEQPPESSEKVEYKIDNITHKKHFQQFLSSLNRSLVSWIVPDNDLNQKIKKDTTLFDLMKKLENGERPKISESTPEVYSVFINSCWSQKAEERPTFEDILEVLKDNNGFILDNVDKNEFLAYVEQIDNYKSNFDISKHDIHFDDFLSKDKDVIGSDDDEETEYEIEYEYDYEEEETEEPKKIVEKEEDTDDDIEEEPKKIIEKEDDENEEPKNIDEKGDDENKELTKIVEKDDDENKEPKKIDEKGKSDKKKEKDDDEKVKKTKSDKKKDKEDVKDKHDKKVKIEKKKEDEKEKHDKKDKSEKKKDKEDEKDKSEKKVKTEKKKKIDKSSKTPEKEKRTTDDKKKVKKIIYPIDEKEQLEKECQKLVKEAEKDPQKQYLVGKHLISGTGNFPQSSQLGIKYLRSSSKNGCDESSLLLGKIYIDGKIIPKDIEEAKEILENVEDKEDSEYLLLIGRIEYKKGNFKRAFKNFNKSVKLGNPEAMYRIGKMYLKGEGTEKDTKKANEYIELSKNNGFVKSIIYSPIPKNKKTLIDSNNDLTDIPSSPIYQLRNRNYTIYQPRNQVHTQYPFENIGNTSKSPPILINMTFVGDKDCGKHKLVFLLSKGLLPNEIPDLIKDPIMTSSFYGELFKIKLIENYGQEENKELNLISYMNTNIFVMVYSMINKTTLNNLIEKWKKEIDNYTKYTYIVLMGVDLEKWSLDPNKENYVTQKDIEDAQKIIKARSSIKCSLETGENVNDLKNKVIGGYSMQFYNPESYIDSMNNSSKTEDLKVLLVGNSDGGQYELLQYIQNEEFNENAELNPVNRVDKLITFKGKKEKHFHFYSTPGDPNCNKIRYMAYHDSQIILLVFSLTKSLSLINLVSNYKIEVDQFAGNAAIVLVGVDVDNWTDNKSDLTITHSSQIKNFMSTAGIHTFIKCSYITGKNMDSFYEKIFDAYEYHNKKKGKKF